MGKTDTTTRVPATRTLVLVLLAIPSTALLERRVLLLLLLRGLRPRLLLPHLQLHDAAPQLAHIQRRVGQRSLHSDVMTTPESGYCAVLS